MVCFFYYQEKQNKLKSWQTAKHDVERGKIATLGILQKMWEFFSERVKFAFPVQWQHMGQDVCPWFRREGEEEVHGQDQA